MICWKDVTAKDCTIVANKQLSACIELPKTVKRGQNNNFEFIGVIT